VQTVRQIKPLRKAVTALRQDGGTVALVPTMGALHAGHRALVDEARKRASHVVVSVFVNPKQFGPNEDLDAYPRRAAKDAAFLTEAGCDLLWLPDVATMYPDGFASTVSVAGVSAGLDGGARPGHFDGVATVVAKLFNQVRPDIAVFGEKDYQQLAVIRRLVRDLNFNIDIVAVATQRDEDGLALSSRNAYLDDAQRIAARALPRALGEAATAIAGGEHADTAIARARAMLEKAGFDPIDYIELRDAVTLDPVADASQPARLLAAARIGGTRLIDNLAVGKG
jgi:pantoate--beta-alanine ligase